ncbi:hypothetical protein ACIQVE_25215 [Pseudomonas sp. NPDC098747]|uniref:hypothetical protein n=1 Tax=Pseudomonas sp. NPDC098747 TaxID=3364487 RepID=UPI00383A58F7
MAHFCAPSAITMCCLAKDGPDDFQSYSGYRKALTAKSFAGFGLTRGHGPPACDSLCHRGYGKLLLNLELAKVALPMVAAWRIFDVAEHFVNAVIAFDVGDLIGHWNGAHGFRREDCKDANLETIHAFENQAVITRIFHY